MDLPSSPEDPRTAFHRLLAETLLIDTVAATALVPLACGGLFLIWGGGGVPLLVGGVWLVVHFVAAIVLVGRSRQALQDGLLDAPSLGIALAAYLGPPVVSVGFFLVAPTRDTWATDGRASALIGLGFVLMLELMCYGCAGPILFTRWQASRRLVTAIVAALPISILILSASCHLRSIERATAEHDRLLDFARRAHRISAAGPLGSHGWRNGHYCADFEIDLSTLSAGERALISIEAVAGTHALGEVWHVAPLSAGPTRHLKVCWKPHDLSRSNTGATVAIAAQDLSGHGLAPWSIRTFEVPPPGED